MLQEIPSPSVALENTFLFPASADFMLDAIFTQNTSNGEIIEHIYLDSNEQNELQRRDTYQTTIDEKEYVPVFI